MDHDTGSSSRSNDLELMQAYSDLPDLADIKTCIDHCFEETHYINTIFFAVREELHALWLRACGMQACLEEVAYLYAFLAIAGRFSPISMDKHPVHVQLLHSITRPKHCDRHAAISAQLLQLSAQRRSENPIQQSSSSPLKVILHYHYDWCNLSRCPDALLRCCTLSLLSTFHCDAYQYRQADQHFQQAVQSARQYNLFQLVKVADEEGLAVDSTGKLDQQQWNTPALRFITGLRRLHFELNVLSQRLSFSLKKRLFLLEDEVSTDSGERLQYGAEDLRLPEPIFDFCRMRIVRGLTMSSAVSKLLDIEAEYELDSERQKKEEEINLKRKRKSSQNELGIDQLDHPDLRIGAFLTLDKTVQQDLDDHWTPYADSIETFNWRNDPVKDVQDSIITIVLLYQKFLANRLRFELLIRLVGSSCYIAQLQAIAMQTAMDTLSFLDKTLLLFQSAWALKGWLVWISEEVNAAIAVFNKTIMHHVVSNQRSSSGHQVELIGSSRRLADAISGTQASDGSSSRLRVQERQAFEGVNPDETDLLFSRFIFSFNNIYETLQDLHVLPMAALEAAQVLKRLRIPRITKLEQRNLGEDPSPHDKDEDDLFDLWIKQ